jgi:murein L,D-transpeptidase YcbB/YkuD
MPNITSDDTLTISASDTAFITTELMLTEAFMRYIAQNDKGINTGQLQQDVPAKKDHVMHVADAVIKNNNDDGLNEDAAHAYSLLKADLKKYYAIAQKGGWESIAFTHKKYKAGANAPAVALFKKRLRVTGEYGDADTSSTFNSVLDSAVRSFQTSLGYTPDGIVTDSLVKDMNVPAEKRVGQLLINLNRLRWMPAEVRGRLIVTNIPEYKLHVYQDKKKAFDMDVVVGKEGAGTVIFTGNLNQIVFSPYWNIPFSIIKKEIVPKMNADKGYMTRERLEITGHSNGLPIVRQLQGPKNSLGMVKFLFHNSYNIYFHDTPEKSLFNHDKRAYSHGCIRLADPVKMADYLLDDSQKWTPEKITAAMHGGKETYVTLKTSVPVIISYYTAWVDETGRLNFRDDIYNHDEDAAAKMFTDLK